MKATTKTGIRAVTLVEVLVVIATLAVLALILLPLLAKPSTGCKRIDCGDNLKQIGLSFKLWAGDNGDRYPMQLSVTNGGTMEWVARGAAWPHFQVLSNELCTPRLLICPPDKTRTIATNFISFGNANVSYFVGVDAEETKPAMLLAGDDNLDIGGKPVSSGLLNLWTNSAISWTKKRHGGFGNVCFVDGSVRQLSNEELREVLANGGVATNRLAIP